MKRNTAYAIWPWGTDTEEQFIQAVKDIREAGFDCFESVAKTVFTKMFEKKYLTSLCKNTLRLAPPLILTKEDIDAFINALKTTLEEI